MEINQQPLTAAEAEKPYSAFYHVPVAPPNPELIQILDKGPMNPEDALLPQDINKLLDPGKHGVETGYCILPDGSAYVAVNNRFPGVTPEMVNWWFAWHSLEDIRYKLWFPEGHFGISISEEDRAIVTNPETPVLERFQGRTHHVVEDTGCGPEDITIRFLKPEEMGFDMSRFKSPAVATVIGANGVSQNRAGGQKAPAVMVHFCREMEGGVEFRTRFWMGWHFIDGKPVKLLPDGIRIPEQAPMGLAYHNVAEYSRLAAILPEMYRLFGPQIK